jgi:hypothetical protein
MTLQEATDELLKLSTQIQLLGAKLQGLEMKYQVRYNDLMLHSKLGNQASREAEAMEIMRTEGSLTEYYETKLNFKNAMTYKEILIEVSKNLRVLEAAK